MARQEGIDILIAVACRIKELGRNDIHFTCVGGGPELEQLKKLSMEKGVADRFNFTGRIPDAALLEILSTADVCVNPDRPCPMNDMSTMIKIMEYMAIGKAIVQFDLKEGRFSAMDASLYADTTNQVEDFARKILWLLDNPDEREKMGAFGRRRVEVELDWRHSEKHLLAAYSRVLESRLSKELMSSTESRN
jgi:glycosyltransferase involved in cell wall biosynthesis